MKTDLPDFIADRLLQLKVLLDMLKDQDWDIADAERERIMSALSYFSDPIDLIPDHIPGIGFLDDARFVEIVIRELGSELEAYEEFVEFRQRKEAELTAAGKDPHSNREEWLLPKRDELAARIREAKGLPSEDFVFHIL